MKLTAMPTVNAEPVVRCKDCWKCGYDNCPMDDYFDSHPKEPDFFCAAGEPEEMRPRSACGPDYCEIGGGDDADAESTKSHSGRFWTKRPTKRQMTGMPWEDGA